MRTLLFFQQKYKFGKQKQINAQKPASKVSDLVQEVSCNDTFKM